MKIGFRTRLLIILALFAVVPAVLLTLLFVFTASTILREISGTEPWEQVATTGTAVLDLTARHNLSDAENSLVEAHRAALSQSLTQASRLAYYVESTPLFAVILAAVALTLLGVATTRVAGHLSRQLSRPLNELVRWTELIARGEDLPESTTGRGAPEFEVLRQRMRRTARELKRSRDRAVEAERLRAFRESARQVAHELKNLLTPIRFAVSRLRRDATASQSEALDTLDMETRHMDEIARSFAMFGKLPEGPPADVDLGEMLSRTVRPLVPEHIHLDLSITSPLPLVHGHYDALARALANVILNAVDATPPGGSISVRVRNAGEPPGSVVIEVSDSGIGIPPDELNRIWEPYVTHKASGTGLGLAITRQTIEAHGGSASADSTVGVGTVVTLVLPTRRSEQAATPATTPE